MEILLPNGQPLMEDLVHSYDPEYARQYYLRTRKLKGRKKAEADAAKGAPSAKDQKTYRNKLDNFLKKLPMAVEGANLKDVEAFVDKMRKMSDDQLKAEAARIKKEKGDNDGAQVATIEALLKNRTRVRAKTAAKKPPAKKPPAKKPAAKKPAASKKPPASKASTPSSPGPSAQLDRRALIALGKQRLGG